VVRRVIGKSSDPQHVLQTRIKLDQMIYMADEDYVEIDIDPYWEVETPPANMDEMITEFGYEIVELANYFFHRHRIWKMRILRVSELDSNDLVAFMLIEEEQNLKQAEDAAKLQSESKKD
jgi:hypothetical protein